MAAEVEQTVSTRPTLDSIFSSGELPEGNGKESEPTPEPVKEEAKSEVKAEEKVTSEPQKEEVKKEEVKTESAKEEAKAEAKEAPKEDRSKPDWESEENSYKKRHAEASRWANIEHEKNLKLEKQLEIIDKKLDGTYDPETDAMPAPTIREVALRGEITGKVKASEAMALEKFGSQEKVDAIVNEFEEKFGKNPIIVNRVLLSNSPVMEAAKVLNEHQFLNKWGTDTAQLETAIRKDEAAKWETKIEELANKRIEERLKKVSSQPKGIGDARTAVESDNSKSAGPKPLESIFA